MIAFLTGKIIKIDGNCLILDVHDVGYKVLLTARNLSPLKINDIVSINIHTHHKEDEITLFGFLRSEEIQIFELLINVSGVGPKTALNILEGLEPNQIISAVQKAKIDTLTKISGLGKKSAQKIILELQSKLGKLSEMSLISETEDQELIQALINLGFSRKEAKAMSSTVEKELPLQTKIKLSLKKS